MRDLTSGATRLLFRADAVLASTPLAAGLMVTTEAGYEWR
jgi:hypothetical protein